MSFAEILVIAVVALVIVGPERLPDAVRKGMLWFGRIKRTINETKTEFEQQLGVDEIRRELHNEQVLKSLKALESSQKEFNKEVNTIDHAVQKQVKQIEASIDDPVHHDTPPNEATGSDTTQSAGSVEESASSPTTTTKT